MGAEERVDETWWWLGRSGAKRLPEREKGGKSAWSRAFIAYGSAKHLWNNGGRPSTSLAKKNESIQHARTARWDFIASGVLATTAAELVHLENSLLDQLVLSLLFRILLSLRIYDRNHLLRNLEFLKLFKVIQLLDCNKRLFEIFMTIFMKEKGKGKI